ncbi:MAG: DUF4445 domain-containing protein [Oscillospiraceae bacterium]|nr:DUF4445 domain-containing protein [Oscillospiraceae bacterium]
MNKLIRITVLPQKQNIEAAPGDNLLAILRSAGLAPEAPCGGGGRCGKCRVLIDGAEALACQTVIDRDIIVTLPGAGTERILSEGLTPEMKSDRGGYLLAFDIGTTTVVGYLLEGKTGRELASHSLRNPQSAFGADVISRIQHALKGHQEALTNAIRQCTTEITLSLCDQAGISPSEITTVSLVGNPAMQQLFLGLSPENLARLPFAPVLTRAQTVSAKAYIPLWENGELLIVPDIAGFVGADTVACVLATELDQQEEITLLVDIGTNGEMVLGNSRRMVACSTAAGPALEGANIQFGMRGQTGAIDHVWLENSKFAYRVIGGGEAEGICGSGLIDAVAAALDAGLLNARGRIQNEDRIIPLTEQIHLTQEDIRQVQLAKGAIAAGIEQLAAHLGITLEDIDRVYLAGAFGTFMDPQSACRIGLLPPALAGKIEPVGNAAGSGAKLLALDSRALEKTQELVSRIEVLELAAVPEFQRRFARNMRF